MSSRRSKRRRLPRGPSAEHEAEHGVSHLRSGEARVREWRSLTAPSSMVTRGSSRSACCASASSLPAKGLSAAGTEVLNKNRPPASLAGSGSERSAGRGGMEARTRAASIWPLGLGRSGLTEKFGCGRAVQGRRHGCAVAYCSSGIADRAVLAEKFHGRISRQVAKTHITAVRKFVQSWSRRSTLWCRGGAVRSISTLPF